MKLLLIGLGNIGAAYTYTRHNMGFLVLDHLAKQQKVFFQANHLAFTATFTYQQQQVYLIKPTTYVNNSGQAVKHWLNALQLPITQSLTVVDDYGLPFGTMRLRSKGSPAGHNGLKNIAACLLSTDYPRLRIGIGSDFPKGGLADFVLGHFTRKEETALPDCLDQAAEIALTWCRTGMVHAMNQFNNRTK
ncbi:MAG: aminoacyl-tRNA hydrolase [Candidatus Cardinium sp.]|nr:aminoacyl-tRNA hydrolase [Candidatus Cardinium sp.]